MPTIDVISRRRLLPPRLTHWFPGLVLGSNPAGVAALGLARVTGPEIVNQPSAFWALLCGAPPLFSRMLRNPGHGVSRRAFRQPLRRGALVERLAQALSGWSPWSGMPWCGARGVFASVPRLELLRHQLHHLALRCHCRWPGLSARKVQWAVRVSFHLEDLARLAT